MSKEGFAKEGGRGQLDLSPEYPTLHPEVTFSLVRGRKVLQRHVPYEVSTQHPTGRAAVQAGELF